MDDKDFFVVLPSGTSLDVYPSNSLTLYQTRLPRPVNLTGRWECALMEFCFPKSYFNFASGGTVSLNMGEEVRTAKIAPGYYPNADILLATINLKMKILLSGDERIVPPTLTYRSADNKVKVHPGERPVNGHVDQFFPEFSPELAEVLGFTPEQANSGRAEYGKNEFDLIGDLHTLFVGSDICAPSFWGDKMASILRSVHVQPGEYGENVCITFDRPLYMPVSRNQFQTIGMYIKDEKFRPIRFQRGRVLMTLHFRQQK